MNVSPQCGAMAIHSKKYPHVQTQPTSQNIELRRKLVMILESRFFEIHERRQRIIIIFQTIIFWRIGNYFRYIFIIRIIMGYFYSQKPCFSKLELFGSNFLYSSICKDKIPAIQAAHSIFAICWRVQLQIVVSRPRRPVLTPFTPSTWRLSPLLFVRCAVTCDSAVTTLLSMPIYRELLSLWTLWH